MNVQAVGVGPDGGEFTGPPARDWCDALAWAAQDAYKKGIKRLRPVGATAKAVEKYGPSLAYGVARFWGIPAVLDSKVTP